MVHIYPGGGRKELGARRWVAEWYLVRPEAMGGEGDLDPDRDIERILLSCTNKVQAVRAARAALQHPRQAYGDACVQEEVVEWFVREDGVGEWVGVGEPEYQA